MLSRVAERLYWFARYVERAENIARLLLVRHQLMLDLPTKAQPEWENLIYVLGAEEAFKGVAGGATEKNVVSFVFGSRDNPGSIISSIAYARENMRTTRDVMPSEAWERVNSLYLSIVQRGKRELPRSVRHKVLNDVIQRCQQLTGMLAGSMSHEDAYQFIRIGRNLERADMTSRIIDVGSAKFMGMEADGLHYGSTLWVGVLKSLSAYQMYRQNIRHRVNRDDVLRFLLQSKTFPRAVAHTLGEIATSIEKLPRSKETLALVRKMCKELQGADVEQLHNSELHDFLDELQCSFDKLHLSIHATWLAPELAA